jgi:hypothetical protein
MKKIVRLNGNKFIVFVNEIKSSSTVGTSAAKLGTLEDAFETKGVIAGQPSNLVTFLTFQTT